MSVLYTPVFLLNKTQAVASALGVDVQPGSLLACYYRYDFVYNPTDLESFDVVDINMRPLDFAELERFKSIVKSDEINASLTPKYSWYKVGSRALLSAMMTRLDSFDWSAEGVSMSRQDVIKLLHDILYLLEMSFIEDALEEYSRLVPQADVEFLNTERIGQFKMLMESVVASNFE